MEPRDDLSRKARLGWDKCKLGESGTVEWNGTSQLLRSRSTPFLALLDPNHFLHGKYSDSHGCQTDRSTIPQCARYVYLGYLYC